jgi:hypothetical protein
LRFLALQDLNFRDLFLHDIGLNFVYVTPHNVPNVHKTFHKILPQRTKSNDFQSPLNHLNSFSQSHAAHLPLGPAVQIQASWPLASPAVVAFGPRITPLARIYFLYVVV